MGHSIGTALQYIKRGWLLINLKQNKTI
jgi:hypothetical protein